MSLLTMQPFHRLGQARHSGTLSRPFARLAAAIRRARECLSDMTSRREPTGVEDDFSLVADKLRTPLTEIRSAGEILRDNPDLDPAARQAFVESVLSSEERLESLVLAILDASRIDPDRRVWRVSLKRLGKGSPATGNDVEPLIPRPHAEKRA